MGEGGFGSRLGDTCKLSIAVLVAILWAAAMTALILPLIDVIVTLPSPDTAPGIIFVLIQDAVAVAGGYFFMEVYLELKTLIFSQPKLPAIDSLPYAEDVKKEEDSSFWDEFIDPDMLNPKSPRKRATAQLYLDCKKTVLSSERIKLIEQWAETASRRNVVSKGEVDAILKLFPPDRAIEAYVYEVFRPFLAKLLHRHRLEDQQGEKKENGQYYDDGDGARPEMGTTASTNSGRTTPRAHGSPRPNRGSEIHTPAGFEHADSDIESIKLMEDKDGDDSAV